MFKSLSSVTYQVADLEQAGQWYRAVLGQEPALNSPFLVTFLIGNAALNLIAADKPSPVSDERVVAYWSVDDIDTAYRRLLELGAVPRAEISTRLNVRL
ncbi:MAG: VOC family protein, partial [Anaerolineae bacterium]|nr:VOC family protein [Anaerolineae bacterium]